MKWIYPLWEIEPTVIVFASSDRPQRVAWSSLGEWSSWTEAYVLAVELDDAIEATLNG